MLFANVGAMGNAILFICSLVLLVLVLTYTLAFALRTYLIVVQGTTAGIDRVDAPDEPMLDWLISAVPTVLMLLLWLIPAGLLARGLKAQLPDLNAAERFFLLAGPFLWLFLPIGLLSSMAAASPWVPLTPGVVFGLIRLAPYTLLFYLVSAVMFALSLGLGYIGLFSPGWVLLPVAAVVTSACWLIHARLVGRLGWLLQQLYNAPPSAKPTRQDKPKKGREKWPEEEEDEEDESEQLRKLRARKKRERQEKRLKEEQLPTAVPGYRVVEQPAEKKEPRPSYLDPEPEPYTLSGGQDEPKAEPVRAKLELEEEQVKREVELRERKPPNPPPEWPMFSGVYQFPAYPTSQKAWLWLSVWGMATGFVFRMVLDFAPF